MARKRLPTKRVIKEIFDPLLKTDVEKVDSPPQEKAVFFKERNRIQIVFADSFSQTAKPPSLPETAGRGSRIPQIFFWLTFALFLTCVSQGAFFLWKFETQTTQRRSFLRTITEEVRALEGKSREVKKEVEDFRRILQGQEEERQSLVLDLRRLRKRFSGERKKGSLLLWEVAQLVPPKVWFQEFSLSPQQISIRAYALDRSSVREFLNSFSRSPHFRSPRLLSLGGIRRPSAPYYFFEVTADVAA